MKTKFTFPANRCRGAVAVETALILPAIVLLFMATFLVGRAYWQYHVLQTASVTAARFIAKGTWQEVASGSREAAAKVMVANVLRDAGLSTDVALSVVCPPKPNCKSATPLPAITVGIDTSGDEITFLFPSGGLWVANTVSYPN